MSPARSVLGRAPLAAALAAVLGLAAACGGSSGTVTETVTEQQGETTSSTAPSERTQELAELLPDTDAIGDLTEGSLTELTDAEALVDQLYREGDPVRDAAIERLQRGGYDIGVLRDQVSATADGGPRLVRTYVVGLATPQAAQTEVGESVAEVERASTAPSRDIEVTGVPGAQGVSLEAQVGPNEVGTALFVTFSSGRFLYGIQTFAQGESESVRQGAVLDAARATSDAGA